MTIADDPDRTPSTGEVIQQMEARLKSRRGMSRVVVVEADELRGWRDCVIEAAARLDPDNPPLTPDELKRMRRKP